MTSMNDRTWLEPIGGLGDIFMASSILKMKVDRDPSACYNVARRNRFMDFFTNHPGVLQIGHPPIGANMMKTMFWNEHADRNSVENLSGPGSRRPFQLLGKKFGLELPIEEEFFFPGDENLGIYLENLIPWKKYNIAISPSSDSDKKNMNLVKWHQLVQMLTTHNDVNVIQTGVLKDRYIKGCFSLLGLTSPGQVFGLLRKCQLLITSDNFIMHAAHYTQTPSIVLWGPTITEIFGYPEHIHIKPPDKCDFFDPCMGRNGHEEINRYHEPCHLPQEKHCMEKISPDDIYSKAMKVLNKSIN